MSGTVTMEAWSFARMDEFLDRLRPLTPWGKDEQGKRQMLASRAVLEERYDDIDQAASALRHDDQPDVDLVSYHLKRMPRLPLEPRDRYELLELFQIKKFLANYRGVVSALDERTRRRFELQPLDQGSAAHALAAELDRGGSDPETFYIADSYDDALPAARAGIAAADAVISRERVRAESEARLAYGVSFDDREFVVAPKQVARAMAESGGRFSVEPFDDSRYVVRLLPSPAAVEAMAERERFADDERQAESRVIGRLSALARDAMPRLAVAVGSLARFDRARAGAMLALELGMTRPVLDAPATVLSGARFVSVADECAAMGLEYTPLSVRFNSDAVVLFGSNMGGKTVVLQTLVFFQLLTQYGLFVPAERFETRVYARIGYVGELSGERLAGLSGFGLEIWRLDRAWAPVDDAPEGGSSFVAFDELARTTGSHEAEALLSAVVEAYAQGRGDRAFFATHFRGVARLPGVEYRRMRGLDREAAAASLTASLAAPQAGPASTAAAAAAELSGRLAGINKHMRYEVVDDDGTGTESDALAIASFLGLDRSIVERARYYLEKDGL